MNQPMDHKLLRTIWVAFLILALVGIGSLAISTGLRGLLLLVALVAWGAFAERYFDHDDEAYAIWRRPLP